MQTIVFLSGTVVGLFVGAILWEVLVAEPEFHRAYEREWRLSDRVRAWQRMWLIAEGARAATSVAMDEITDNDRHSVKVPDLTVVK